MSEQYRLMIYFAVATMHLYSKDIGLEEDMAMSDFKERNEKVLKRVFDEAKSIFDYELSGNQMEKAISAYAQGELRPQSVEGTEPWELPEEE